MDRFLSKLHIADDHWDYMGALDRDGYGVYWHEGRVVRAHRLAFERWVGPIPDGMVVHHRCHRRSCCRPGCLRLLTPAENAVDRLPRRRLERCRLGHLFSDVGNAGKRRCLECKRSYNAQWMKQRRAAARLGDVARKAVSSPETPTQNRNSGGHARGSPRAA